MDNRIAKRPPDVFFKLVTDPWTRPFWDNAAEGYLSAPRCAPCGVFRMPPRPFCPACRSQDVEWVRLSGTGRLYTYTIVERATSPGMDDCIPYVPAVVEIPDADGVRLISNIVETPIFRIAIGARLSVMFDRLSDGVTVPRFRVSEAP